MHVTIELHVTQSYVLQAMVKFLCRPAFRLQAIANAAACMQYWYYSTYDEWNVNDTDKKSTAIKTLALDQELNYTKYSLCF